jgi:hypothetical protein
MSRKVGARDRAPSAGTDLSSGPFFDRRTFIGMSVALPFIPRDLIDGPPPRPVMAFDQYRYILDRYAIQDFLPIIVDECRRQQEVFPLEPEVEVAKLRQESLFDPAAISLAGAVGIAQFIPETASEEFGMKVYVTPDYTNGVALRKELAEENRQVSAALRDNKFKLVEQHKLRADALSKRVDEHFIRYKKDLESKIAGASAAERAAVDQRLDPERCIRNGIRYLAGLCRTCSDRFHGSVRHNVLRGLAAYNAGLDQVLKFDGMPFIFQTVDYVRKIMVMYDQLMETRR